MHMHPYLQKNSNSELCVLLVKSPFMAKKELIRCGGYESPFHRNCLQSGVTETTASATVVKSDYKRDNFKKLTGDTAKVDSVSKSTGGSIINGG